MILELAEYSAIIITVIGTLLTSRHEVRFLGFSILIISNVLWVVYLYVTSVYLMAILFIIYMISNITGARDEYPNRIVAYHNIIFYFKKFINNLYDIIK